MKKLSAIALLVSLVLAACGSGGSDGSNGPGMAMPEETAFDGSVPPDAKAYPVVVSSEIVVGKNRFLVGVLNDEDAPIGSPDIEVHARFFDLDSSATEPATEADLDFLETIPGARGLYVGHVTFDSAGKWGAEVDITGNGIDETVRTKSFDVLEEGTTPAIGAPAPASDTATADDVKKLSEITTDPRPDRDFYAESIKDALKQDRPFVVVFATPKFCTSQVCGPTLNIVKKVSPDFPELTFIHVEVYENLDDPSNLQVVDSVNEWKLPTEPWVFVVDRRGRIAAKYEGTVGAHELRAELKKL